MEASAAFILVLAVANSAIARSTSRALDATRALVKQSAAAVLTLLSAVLKALSTAASGRGTAPRAAVTSSWSSPQDPRITSR